MQIILGEETIKEISREEFKYFELDLISVKGKSEPVSIYTVFEEIKVADEIENFMKEHSKFLENYRAKNWNEAIEHIEKYRFSIPEFTLYYTPIFERINDLS